MRKGSYVVLHFFGANLILRDLKVVYSQLYKVRITMVLKANYGLLIKEQGVALFEFEGLLFYIRILYKVG